ncbi:hypothetical protein ACA910_016242 [Epithemia clementina (nom. ined.)]
MLDNDEIQLLHATLTGDLALTQRLVSLNHVDVNCAHPASGMTPLTCATHGGHLMIVRFLVLSVGANIDLQCSLGSAVLVASVLGHADIVEFLSVQGADINAKGKNGITPISVACNRGHLEVVEVLANHGGPMILQERVNEENGFSAFACAFMADRFEVLRYLVDIQGMDVNARLRKCRNTTPLFFAATQRNLPMVSFLLELGADIERTTDEGESALFTACRGGAFPVVRCLLEHHANVNTVTRDGTTPLMAAIHSLDEKTIIELLEHGADANHGAPGGVTPLFMATSKGLLGVVRALVEFGASLEDGQSSVVLLHLACRVGNVSIVQYLLDQKPVLRDACNTDRWISPVTTACEHKHTNLVLFLVRQMVAGSLFSNKTQGSKVQSKCSPMEID